MSPAARVVVLQAEARALAALHPVGRAVRHRARAAAPAGPKAVRPAAANMVIQVPVAAERAAVLAALRPAAVVVSVLSQVGRAAKTSAVAWADKVPARAVRAILVAQAGSRLAVY